VRNAEWIPLIVLKSREKWREEREKREKRERNLFARGPLSFTFSLYLSLCANPLSLSLSLSLSIISLFAKERRQQ
jgi:hypothetical protein